MKKIYCILLAAVTFGACESLDQEPSTSVSKTTAITSVEDLAYAVNGAYYVASGRTQLTLTGELAIYADELGPDSNVENGSGQYAQKIHERSITSNDSWNAYYYLYRAIANVNQAFEASKKFENENGVDELTAELYGIRGLFHFHLATFFAHIPTAGNPNKMGIVLSTEVYPLSYKAGRASLDETYQQIIDDLTACINSGLNKEIHDGHVNYWAALALRARAYLYWGKYDLALADAKKVITESPYALYTRDNYVSSWSADNGSEVILEYVQDDDYNAQRYAPGYHTHPDGYHEYSLTEDFYNFMKENPDDIRSEMVAWRTTETGNGKDGYYPMKYPGKTGSIVPLYANSIKVVRLSEMYLIAAEASLKSSSAKDAADWLNALRRNRIAGYEDVDTTDIDDIIDERRKELFAEGQIAFDYWRNGKSFRCGARDFGPESNLNILPIPKEEIDVNGGLLQQNPGY